MPLQFPTLPGIAFASEKTPIWATRIGESVSGKERRAQLWSYPRWRFNVAADFLRSNASYPELQTLWAFFNSLAGQYGDFYYLDPYDNAASGMAFATGNGTTTTFQVTRTTSAGGFSFTEPVLGFFGTPALFVNGVRNYSYARTNYALQSRVFNNASWTKTNLNVTTDATTDPDGGSAADKLTASTTSNVQHYVSQSVTTTATTWTESFYLKQSDLTWAYVECSNPAVGAYFNLAAGAVGTTVGAVKAAIEPAANGFYRCSLTFTGVAASVNMRVYLATANGTNTYAGTVGQGIFIYQAQFEADTAPTLGINTTTTAVTVAAQYSVGSLGKVTFVTAPAAAAALTWSGQYQFLCRFNQDNLSTEQLWADVWSDGGLQFISVKR